MKVLNSGGYAISDQIKVDGEGGSVFVFGRGWLLEVVELTRGDYYFYSDGKKVRPASGRFGVYYPCFSMVRAYSRDIKGMIVGVGAVKPLEGLPDHPVIFETDFKGEFTDVGEAIDVLKTARDVRSIEINTHPSPLTMKCKKLIDENYLVYPSIARIAARLSVSHEHMTRLFKRDFGMSPSAYLHQLRVSEATFRLSLGEEIIDISGEVGYNDLSRFYKQFKKQTATSPAQCRLMFEKPAERSTSKNAKTGGMTSR